MRPGPRLVRAVWWTAGASLLVPLLPQLYWLPLALGVLLAGAALVEASLLSRVTVAVEGRPSHVLPLGESETLTFELRTSASRPLDVALRLVWPPLLDAASTERQGRAEPGRTLRFDVPVLATARGRAALEPPAVALTAWGLAERRVRPDLESELAVVPDLKAVGRLHAKLNHFALRGMGTRLSARLGKGREFDRLRDYVLGDEFRDVAWKASARHGRLIVREFRLDRSQDVLLCLDSGHLMAARVSGLSRLDHAVNAAVLLAYVCDRIEDRVGVLSFAASVSAGPRPGRGSAHLRRLTAFASGTRAAYLHTDYRALAAELRRRLRRRTLVVILTALGERDREPLLEAVAAVQPQHLALVVALHDPDLEARAQALPADRRELCRVLVAQELAWNRAQTVRELRRRGALVVESTPTDAGTDAMNAYIEVKRRQLL